MSAPFPRGLAKTKAAIEVLDAKYAGRQESDLPYEAEIVQLDALVGAAFAEETSDINDPVFVAKTIRAGPPYLLPGEVQLSFVRRMVALWERGAA